jgi:hypothetical protein
MDPQTRAAQIWLESHVPELGSYFMFTGRKVFCPHCGADVSIKSKVGMQDPDPASGNPNEVFKTSCQHEAIGEFSSGYDAEWIFWIE